MISLETFLIFCLERALWVVGHDSPALVSCQWLLDFGGFRIKPFKVMPSLCVAWILGEWNCSNLGYSFKPCMLKTMVERLMHNVKINCKMQFYHMCMRITVKLRSNFMNHRKMCSVCYKIPLQIYKVQELLVHRDGMSKKCSLWEKTTFPDKV